MTDFPVKFPFLADYVDQFQIGGGGFVTARQRVEVLERFGMNYRIRSLGDLRIPDINRPLHEGETMLVKRAQIFPVSRGECEHV